LHLAKLPLSLTLSHQGRGDFKLPSLRWEGPGEGAMHDFKYTRHEAIFEPDNGESIQKVFCPFAGSGANISIAMNDAREAGLQSGKYRFPAMEPGPRKLPF